MNPLSFIFAGSPGMALLRAGLAVLMLFHGWAKITKGVSGIEGMLTNAGLPGLLAYGVYVGEVLAPVLMLFGLFVGPAAWLIAINMLFAIGLAHSDAIFALGKNGAPALELQYFFLLCSVAVALDAGRSRMRLVQRESHSRSANVTRG